MSETTAPATEGCAICVDQAMRTVLRLTVPGDPVPKGRPRVVNGHTYTPTRTRDAEEAMRWRIIEALGPGFQPLSEAVSLRLEFYRGSRRRVDGDNLQKLCQDAMNGLVYVDDSQVKNWEGTVYEMDEHKSEPRTEISVAVWDVFP